jgi:hypothetical protein
MEILTGVVVSGKGLQDRWTVGCVFRVGGAGELTVCSYPSSQPASASFVV